MTQSLRSSRFLIFLMGLNMFNISFTPNPDFAKEAVADITEHLNSIQDKSFYLDIGSRKYYLTYTIEGEVIHLSSPTESSVVHPVVDLAVGQCILPEFIQLPTENMPPKDYTIIFTEGNSLSDNEIQEIRAEIEKIGIVNLITSKCSL
jgi:hypothetical protein